MKRVRLLSLILAFSLVSISAVAQTAEHPGHTEYMVAMRDGVKLATSVYLPEGEGPWPVVLSRTPYNKDGGRRSANRFTEEGYAFVIQDQRGKFKSEGVYTPHENGMHDGYDTVEWCAAQPWSTGKVGMTGASALGIAANLAAAAAPPHLVCAYVTVAPQSLFYEGRFIGGVFKEADTGNWMRRQGVSEEEITKYRQRVVLDQRWKDTDLVFQRHTIEIPVYNVGGWFDLFLHGNISNFQYLQQWGRDGARGNQKLLMGPFGHGQVRGDVEYPDAQDRSVDEIRWFDFWLKGVDNGVMDEPPVRYYMTAAARTGDPSEKNRWLTAETWPPSETVRTPFYLTEGLGISRVPQQEGDPITEYKADPANPVPTVGGPNLTLPLGPMDQREIGEREDYLRFETEPLDEDLVIAGKVDLELWAASDGPDTDFMVKLVDVYPDGYEALIVDTALRARFRDGRRADDIEMLTPGEPEKMTVDLWHTAVTIEKGHKLAVHISSSNHPRFEVNPNTGEAPGEETLEPRVATNTVYHDANHPTALVVDVIPD